jgi:uncharacterized cupredoxin-like copper-binding protein
MPRKNAFVYLMLTLVIGLVVAACSSSSTTDATIPASMSDLDPMSDTAAMSDPNAEHTEFSFGELAEASEATRVIEITTNDNFTFDPDALTVEAGEVVTFRVTNNGKIPHDFTLGDAATQDEHEEEMQNMSGSDGMGMEDPNAFALEPGETKEMTWRMTGTGEILMGCHQPGHYAAGMKGTIDING